MKTKRLLPYLAIPIIIIAYVLLRRDTLDIITALRGSALIAFGFAAALTDWKARTVSNKLVLAMFALWLTLLIVAMLSDFQTALGELIPSLISGGVAGLMFLAIYLVSRKGIGGGDVKLVTVVGLYMTLAQLMPMLLVSSLLAAIVSAVLLLTKRATMKTAIPLVPFLYLGILVILFLGV